MAARRALGGVLAALALLLISPDAFAQPFPNLQASATMATSATSLTKDGQNITVRCVAYSSCTRMVTEAPAENMQEHVCATFDQLPVHPHLVSNISVPASAAAQSVSGCCRLPTQPHMRLLGCTTQLCSKPSQVSLG